MTFYLTLQKSLDPSRRLGHYLEDLGCLWEFCTSSLHKECGQHMTHKFMAFILISKEEFLLCKILLKEFDCKLNVVQHLSQDHLRNLIFERKSLNGHVNFPFTYPIPNSISVLSDHQKVMSWTTLSQSIKNRALSSDSLLCPLISQKAKIKSSLFKSTFGIF